MPQFTLVECPQCNDTAEVLNEYTTTFKNIKHYMAVTLCINGHKLTVAQGGLLKAQSAFEPERTKNGEHE